MFKSSSKLQGLFILFHLKKGTNEMIFLSKIEHVIKDMDELIFGHIDNCGL